MKTLTKILCLNLCLLAAACATTPAQDASGSPHRGGGGKADGSQPSLSGAGAAQLAQIVENAGGSVGLHAVEDLPNRYLEAFDVFCLGQNGQNTCFASAQDADPASSRAEIAGADADKIWHLLKQAGIPVTISTVSDGTAGDAVLEAGTLRCTVDTEDGFASCTMDPDSAADDGAHAVHGADATKLAQIVETDGASVGVVRITTPGGTEFLEAYDLFCVGLNFHNTCFVSSQDIDPAASRADISDPTATTVWSLLKKAGFKAVKSTTSDGSAGSYVIAGGTLRCTFNTASAIADCTLSGE